MKRPRFETYKARDGWRWRLLAANGRVLAQGEGHPRKGGATRAINTVRLAVIRASLPTQSAVRGLRPLKDSSSGDYPAPLC